MAGSNINRVIITGNLTRDPEQRTLPSGASVTSLRIACNGRRRNGETQQWEDVPNYFDVSVWGPQGENCQRYLTKGRGVAIDGQLRWREWTDKNGDKRQSVDINADTVQFLGGGEGGNGAGNSGSGYSGGYSNGGSSRPQGDVAINTNDFEVSPVGGGSDDDIPF